MNYGFAHDSAGQLTKVIFPYGGYLKWDYSAWNYSGSRKQMEVSTRYLSKDGSIRAIRAIRLHTQARAMTDASHSRQHEDY